MSKKKKKFKKKISQNLSERLAQIKVEEKTKEPIAISSPAGSEITAEGVVMENKYAYVKKDIRKDFLIIIGLLIILSVAVILNQKTTYLSNMADWLYKTLNLSV